MPCMVVDVLSPNFQPQTSTSTMKSAELYHETAIALFSIAQLPRFCTNIKEVEVTRHSNVRNNWANICWHALLTSVKGQVTEYKETTKLSMT